MNSFKYVINRRRELKGRLNLETDIEKWAETCLPSYCHSNIFAAYVSWLRLFEAVNFFEKALQKSVFFSSKQTTNILDFGCGTAELRFLLPASINYRYVENNPLALAWLNHLGLKPARIKLEQLPKEHFDLIFALDSLEHNEDYQKLVARIIKCLVPGGSLIISGPTENTLYKLGRRIARFSGHYHCTTISDINREVDSLLLLEKRKIIPFGLPLFSISQWIK